MRNVSNGHTAVAAAVAATAENATGILQAYGPKSGYLTAAAADLVKASTRTACDYTHVSASTYLGRADKAGSSSAC